MLGNLISSLVGSRHRDVTLTAAGMLALLAGQKKTAISLFATGAYGLEQDWRRRHPEFTGGIKERFQLSGEFYESTHKNSTNRVLHMVGIPMIVGGTLGLLAYKPFRPRWSIAATSFAVGWGLNFIGHGVYEKAAPAFRDDPLSFLAGPIWDLALLRSKLRKGEAKAEAAPVPTVVKEASATDAPSTPVNGTSWHVS
jgi:hypothetical protein